MKITAIEAVAVTIPIEAPLRHSYGVHRAFTRTIVRMRTDTGLEGLAETAASPQQVELLGSAIIGLDPFDLELVRARVSQRFYWSKEPLVASALEMACIDLQGKHTGLPAYKLLGGRVRDSIEMAAYCFYRYEGAHHPAVATPDEMAAHAADLVETYGFSTVKLKAGVLDPVVEVDTLQAIRDRLGPGVKLRIDPNAAWTPVTATGLAPRLEEIGLEYLEDPSPGIEGMSTVRTRTRLPLATNMCVVSFEELVPAVRRGAIDVVLSDPWYWGGVRQTKLLASMCEHLGISVGMHSGIELGIGMAAMAHVGVTIPSLLAAVDAHYHHLTDDVIVGPRLLPSGGHVAPPEGPGWGVELDEDKVREYAALHASGEFANLYVAGDPDVGPDAERPSWFPTMPAW
jgi:glucarate dehydratase